MKFLLYSDIGLLVVNRQKLVLIMFVLVKAHLKSKLFNIELAKVITLEE